MTISKMYGTAVNEKQTLLSLIKDKIPGPNRVDKWERKKKVS